MTYSRLYINFLLTTPCDDSPFSLRSRGYIREERHCWQAHAVAHYALRVPLLTVAHPSWRHPGWRLEHDRLAIRAHSCLGGEMVLPSFPV